MTREARQRHQSDDQTQSRAPRQDSAAHHLLAPTLERTSDQPIHVLFRQLRIHVCACLGDHFEQIILFGHRADLPQSDVGHALVCRRSTKTQVAADTLQRGRKSANAR